MMTLSQTLILALMLDAAWVANGLVHHRDMWKWTVLYWVILSVKNAVDWLGGRKRRDGR